MSDQTPQSPPPGWYPDSQGVTRWWDGTRWTEYTAPRPQPAAVQPIQQTAVTRYKQRNRWGFHIIMSICTAGLWVFTGLPIMVAWNYFRSGKKTQATKTVM